MTEVVLAHPFLAAWVSMQAMMAVVAIVAVIGALAVALVAVILEYKD